MSAETYLIECVSAKGDVACFRLHSEEGEAPLSKSFYLEILVEFYEQELKGRLHGKDLGTVAKRSLPAYLKKATSSPARAHLDHLLTLLHDQKVEITAEELAAYHADRDAFEAKYQVKTSGAGSSGDTCYYRLPADIAAFKAMAETDILRVTPRLVAQDHLDEDIDDEDNPYRWSEVEFQVATPKLLKHVVPGTVWGSAMYEFV
jgi:hypothetical protein